MFGIVICNKATLEKIESDSYQAAYCGLCRAIKQKYGQMERMALNYDMTFVAILLNSLYEENNTYKNVRCPIHPLKVQKMYENKYLKYAADMTILLTYYKCLDDWNDENSKTKKFCAHLLEKHMKELKRVYPRQTSAVQKSIEHLNYLEKSAPSSVDEIVNCSGRMLQEIFVYQEDFWSDSLRNMGYELGRFIYLMDAALDYEEDQKKDFYNPLIYLGKEPKDIQVYLEMAMGNVAVEFEKLPIIQDAHLLRNIIYGGVWQQYYVKIKGKEEKRGK